MFSSSDYLRLSASLSVCMCVFNSLSFMLNRRQLEKPFPEQLYTGGSTFFIGSRRRWSGLFSVRDSTCLTHLSHMNLSLTSTHLSQTSIFCIFFILYYSLLLYVLVSLSHCVVRSYFHSGFNKTACPPAWIRCILTSLSLV